jgi:hypothetical protein
LQIALGDDRPVDENDSYAKISATPWTGTFTFGAPD